LDHVKNIAVSEKTDVSDMSLITADRPSPLYEYLFDHDFHLQHVKPCSS